MCRLGDLAMFTQLSRVRSLKPIETPPLKARHKFSIPNPTKTSCVQHSYRALPLTRFYINRSLSGVDRHARSKCSTLSEIHTVDQLGPPYKIPTSRSFDLNPCICMRRSTFQGLAEFLFGCCKTDKSKLKIYSMILGKQLNLESIYRTRIYPNSVTTLYTLDNLDGYANWLCSQNFI